MNSNNIDYKTKYLKYKTKYLSLKELKGGAGEDKTVPKYPDPSVINMNDLKKIFYDEYMKEVKDKKTEIEEAEAAAAKIAADKAKTAAAAAKK
jgi:hypothetical protein